MTSAPFHRSARALLLAVPQALVLLLGTPPALAPAAAEGEGTVVFPGASWDARSPEEAGLDPRRLDSFRRRIGGEGPGVVTRDGYLVYEWGPSAARGEWGSASKAMFSTLLLFALTEGRVEGVDAPVANWRWPLRGADRAMTLRHLLDMTSGYGTSQPPGSSWAYNDYGVKLLAETLLGRIYRVDPTDAAAVEALFVDPARLGPLGFEDPPLFTTKRDAPRVSMSARDYARVGWFWLNRGRWGELQLLPVDYFERHLRVDVPETTPPARPEALDDYLGLGTAGGGHQQTPLGPGRFGFMWWFNEDGKTWPDAPRDTFQVNGHWNREVMTVIPSLGIVAAWRGGREADPDDFFDPMNDVLRVLVAATGNDPERAPFGAAVGVAALIAASLVGVWWLRRRRRTL